jgi:hypothetical protein
VYGRRQCGVEPSYSDDPYHPTVSHPLQVVFMVRAADYSGVFFYIAQAGLQIWWLRALKCLQLVSGASCCILHLCAHLRLVCSHPPQTGALAAGALLLMLVLTSAQQHSNGPPFVHFCRSLLSVQCACVEDTLTHVPPPPPPP